MRRECSDFPGHAINAVQCTFVDRVNLRSRYSDYCVALDACTSNRAGKN